MVIQRPPTKHEVTKTFRFLVFPQREELLAVPHGAPLVLKPGLTNCLLTL